MGTIDNTAALIKAAKVAISALESCYNVTDFPSDGETLQDEAVALLREALAAIEQQPTPDSPKQPDSSGENEGQGVEAIAREDFHKWCKKEKIPEKERWAWYRAWHDKIWLPSQIYTDAETIERLLAGVDVEDVARDISTAIEEIGGEYTAGYVDAEDELRVAQAAIASIKRQIEGGK